MPVWEPTARKERGRQVAYSRRRRGPVLLLAAVLLGAFGVFYFTRQGNAPVRAKPSPAAVAHASQYQLLTNMDADPASWMAWSPDKHTVAALNASNSPRGASAAGMSTPTLPAAEFYDLLSSRTVLGSDGIAGWGLLWSPGGSVVASSPYTATISLLDPATGRITHRLTVPPPAELPPTSSRGRPFSRLSIQGLPVGWISDGRYLVSLASLAADDTLPSERLTPGVVSDYVAYATVQVWDAVSGDLVRNFVVADKARIMNIGQVRLSPDGATLALVSTDSGNGKAVPSISVSLWDTASGRQLAGPPIQLLSATPGGPVTSYIEWSPDSRTLAVANGPAVGLLERGKTQYSRTLGGQPGAPVPNTATPAMSAPLIFATATAMRYPPPPMPVSTGGPGALPPIPLPVSTAGFMPGSGAIIGSGPAGFMQPSSPFSNVPLIGQLVPQGPPVPAPTPTLDPAQPGSVQIISWSPTGDLLASYDGRAVRVWDVAKGTVRSIIDLGTSNRQGNYASFRPGRQNGPLAWSLDGTMLATLNSDGWSGPPAVHLWDPATGAEVRELGRGAMQIEWSPYADVLAIRYPGRTELWGVRSSLEGK